MNPSGSAVDVNSPIGTVTGGWYREKMTSYTAVKLPHLASEFLNSPVEDRVSGLGSVVESPAADGGYWYSFSLSKVLEEIKDQLDFNRALSSNWRKILDRKGVSSFSI